MLTTLLPNVATQIPSSKTMNTVVLNLSSNVSVDKCNSQEFGGNFAILTIPPNGIYTAKAGDPVWLRSSSETQVWTEETATNSYNLAASAALPSPSQILDTSGAVLLVDQSTVTLDIAPSSTQTVVLTSSRSGAALCNVLLVMVAAPNPAPIKSFCSVQGVLVYVSDSVGNLLELDEYFMSQGFTSSPTYYNLGALCEIGSPSLIGNTISLAIDNVSTTDTISQDVVISVLGYLESPVGESGLGTNGFNQRVAGVDSSAITRPLLTDDTGVLQVAIGGNVSLSPQGGTLTSNVALSSGANTTVMTTASLAAGTWLVTMQLAAAMTTATSGVTLSVEATAGTATTTFIGPSEATIVMGASTDTQTVSVTVLADITAAGTLDLVGTMVNAAGTAEATYTGWTAIKVA